MEIKLKFPLATQAPATYAHSVAFCSLVPFVRPKIDANQQLLVLLLAMLVKTRLWLVLRIAKPRRIINFFLAFLLQAHCMERTMKR